MTETFLLMWQAVKGLPHFSGMIAQVILQHPFAGDNARDNEEHTACMQSDAVTLKCLRAFWVCDVLSRYSQLYLRRYVIISL